LLLKLSHDFIQQMVCGQHLLHLQPYYPLTYFLLHYFLLYGPSLLLGPLPVFESMMVTVVSGVAVVLGQPALHLLLKLLRGPLHLQVRGAP